MLNLLGLNKILRNFFQIFLLFISFYSSLVYSDFFMNMGKSLPANSYSIDLNSDFFLMTNKFDLNGSNINLLDVEKFSRVNTNIAFTYAFTRKVDLSLGGRYRLQQSIHGTQALNYDLKASGVERLFMKAHYYISLSSKTRFAFEFYASKSMYAPKDFNQLSIPINELALGDGGVDFWFGTLFFKKISKSFSLNSLIKYRIPPNSLSKEINYRSEILLNPRGGNGFIFSLGLEGIYSLKTDVFTSDPLLKPKQATGSSNQYNSINRNQNLAYGGLNYKFDSSFIFFRGGKVIQGSSTDGGAFFSTGITFYSKSKYQKFNPDHIFKEYELEALVLEVSPRKQFIKIDQGVSGDVEKGMKIDLFKSDHFGKNELIARGYVFKAGVDQSIVKIIQMYKKIEIEKGFIARGYFISD